jgi:glycosyltransferase involved in cell wall biosynthesis
VNILLVTDSYPPEIRSASHLMLELAQQLSLKGHEVTVITTWPEYNLDQNIALHAFNESELEGRIRVVRIKTLPHHNVNYLVRGLAQLLMPWQFLRKLQQYKIKPEAVVVYSPPLPLALVGSTLRRKGARYLLNVQDLFPQNAIDLGILRSSIQIKLFKALEQHAYKTADIVTVHSEGNKKVLIKEHPHIAQHLRILHNWVDVDHHTAKNPAEVASEDFRIKWGIRQRHVAVFAGVMGPSQYLDLILDIAENMQDQTDLLFLLVGDGKEKQRLQALAQAKNLSNVRFEGFISREAYPKLLNACTIGLVCLSPQNKTPVVPGKILGHMAAGLPVAAFLQTASDGHKLIQDANCGVSANSADLSECIKAMKTLLMSGTNLQALGQAGKDYAIANFSKDVCVTKLEQMLLQGNKSQQSH